jgi:spermidine synthase/MFS family permease
MPQAAMLRGPALLLTLLTGFTGLVYQVAWQRVLATLLGSHAEATAAVLGLFLGGLSLGYALFGRLSRRLAERARRRGGRPGLLLAYGAVEAGVGLLALLFPQLFVAVQALSLRLPASESGLAFGPDVLLASLLVLPPTLLMGGTIPLLTQALSRDTEDSTRLHSLVYAFNTAGACAGALAGGYLLLPWLGLETAIRAMGCLNLAAGLAFAALHLRESAAVDPPGAPAAAALPAGLRTCSAVALLAGFSMMTLQTAANRIGALALGASPFTFATVVAVFVLCIALGSFAVAALPRVPRTLPALSQWALAASLLLLYPAVQDAPFWAHVVRLRIPAGELYAFNAAVGLALLAVCLVPIGLSGALLPLLFHHLRREAADLGRVAGRLYAWNTVGSLLGALLGGYLLLFWLDLHALYRIAVLALAVGAALLTPRVELAGRRTAALALAVFATALALQSAWEPRRLTAGLFRAMLPREHFAGGPDAYFESPASSWLGDRLRFYTDDPVSSVAVLDDRRHRTVRSRAILVNGKADGRIPNDDVTTGLLALLPALFAERCERAFVIGWGTGMTVGELAALESTREVVVAEISPGVMQASRFFDDRNRDARLSPKTRVVRSDAYRALLRDDARYDVIVSEPSNPWVTGVEMLYSLEFLRAARSRLTPGGVYAQWFHTYETDAETMELVLRTYREAFPRVWVWRAMSTDLVILGFADAHREPDLAALEERWQRPDFQRQLTALEIRSLVQLLAHELLPLGVLGAMDLPDSVHTLLHPRLSHVAARAFYRRGSGDVPPGLTRPAAEAGAQGALVGRLRMRHGGALPVPERRALLRETCEISRSHCATLFAHWSYQEPDSPQLAESLAEGRTKARLAKALQPRVLEGLVRLFGPDATAGRPSSFRLASDLTRVFTKYYAHAAPFDAESLRAAWRRCAATDPRCEAGLERAVGMGRTPTTLSQR